MMLAGQAIIRSERFRPGIARKSVDKQLEVDRILKHLAQVPADPLELVRQVLAKGGFNPEGISSVLAVLASYPLGSYIVSAPDVLGGKPRINGRRISVQDVAIWHERMGMSVDEIATNYDLTLGQVYAALGYFHDHREEIEIHMRRGQARIEGLKARFPSKLAEHRNG
jgi:uncharacterized protein (DUF433 family)